MQVDFQSLAIIVLVSALAPIIANLIPKKLVPETVLLLIAGAALGMNGFGIINKSPEIDMLSDLGMAFLFLLAGYEIDPKHIAGKQGGRAVITWFASFGLGMLILIPLVGLRLGTAPSFSTAIALTTTAIGTLMPILSERGVLGTKVGDLVLSYGTYGELMPILAMALLLSSRSSWETMAVLFAFFAIAVFIAWRARAIGRNENRLTRFLLDRANTNSQTLVRITVCLLIGLIAISEIFDLDIILGAFAAGFVLRYVAPEGHETLDTSLQAMGYGFFIPIFFVVSGISINLSSIGKEWVMLLVYILQLLVVRFVPIFVSLALHRDTREVALLDRVATALYCTTALPLIVAVTNVAVSIDAMPQEIANTMVAAGAVTVLIMPLLASICQSRA